MYAQLGRQRTNLLLFWFVEMKHRIEITGRRLHLDRNPGAPQADNEVELAPTDRYIAIEDVRTTIIEKNCGETLAESTEVTTTQRAEVGSSSSMLTSRKVITFTLLTNRAGRYISHTHASFNSSSK